MTPEARKLVDQARAEATLERLERENPTRWYHKLLFTWYGLAALLLPVALIAALASCSGDPNSKPLYAEGSGLPKNCRAIVQANIDAFRAKQYTAEEIMDSLERNCGANGHSWGR